MKGIGLALGGGGAKGYAHIGVLKELERNNIPVTSISGVSAGSLVAAMYACGLSPDEIESIATETDWTSLIEFTAPKYGLATLRKFSKAFKRYIGNKKFNQTRIPLRIVAVDVDTGKPYVFSKGSVTKSVVASISMPSIFEPVMHKGKRLVDGGIIQPVPIDELRELGAKPVVAVDLTVTVPQRHDYTAKDGQFIKNLKREFIYTQTHILNEFLKLKRFRLPGPLYKIKNRLIDHFLEPRRVYNLIYNHSVNQQIPEILQILSKSLSISRNELSKVKIKSADIVIKPKFVGIRAMEVEKAKLGIKEGERATREMITVIKKAIR